MSEVSLMELSSQQMEQQIDLSCRLLHLSLLGVPRQVGPNFEITDPEVLAMHALITAYSALAKASPSNAAAAIDFLEKVDREVRAKKHRLDAGETKAAPLFNP